MRIDLQCQLCKGGTDSVLTFERLALRPSLLVSRGYHSVHVGLVSLVFLPAVRFGSGGFVLQHEKCQSGVYVALTCNVAEH